jgi:hypothetical protein
MTQTDIGIPPASLGLKVGDLVEVLSAREILETLEERGPEMLAFLVPRINRRECRAETVPHNQPVGHAAADQRCAPDRLTARQFGPRWLPDSTLVPLQEQWLCRVDTASLSDPSARGIAAMLSAALRPDDSTASVNMSGSTS